MYEYEKTYAKNETCQRYCTIPLVNYDLDNLRIDRRKQSATPVRRYQSGHQASRLVELLGVAAY